jgi:bile acid:Na+ symporter, BASS family
MSWPGFQESGKTGDAEPFIYQRQSLVMDSALTLIGLPVALGIIMLGLGLGLQFDKVLQVFAIVLIPIAIGMAVRARVPSVAERLGRPVKIFSVIVLVAVIVGAVLRERENVADYFISVGLAVLVFNLLSLAIGYGVPRLAGVEQRAATAAGFEIGVHNSTLAITIAISPALLNNTQMAIPGAVYGIVMFSPQRDSATWSPAARPPRPPPTRPPGFHDIEG